jgi:hypothetical protein
MRVGIIGTGTAARSIARPAKAAGHTVDFGSRRSDAERQHLQQEIEADACCPYRKQRWLTLSCWPVRSCTPAMLLCAKERPHRCDEPVVAFDPLKLVDLGR